MSLTPAVRSSARSALALAQHHRQHVRPLGDDRHLGTRAVILEGIRHGCFDARRRLDEARRQHVGRQPVGDDLDPCLPAHLRQLFELPLVQDEVVLAEDPLHEHFKRWVFAEERLEFGTTQTLGETGREDDRAPLLDDRKAARQPLDRLVERRVQGIAGGAGDDDVHRF